MDIARHTQCSQLLQESNCIKSRDGFSWFDGFYNSNLSVAAAELTKDRHRPLFCSLCEKVTITLFFSFFFFAGKVPTISVLGLSSELEKVHGQPTSMDFIFTAWYGLKGGNSIGLMDADKQKSCNKQFVTSPTKAAHFT